MIKGHVAESVNKLRRGANPEFDAWLYNFLIENNLDHLMNPTLIATPEQLRFMVHLEEDQVYMPCSDATFNAFLDYPPSSMLKAQYNRVWRIVARMVRHTPSLDPAFRRKVLLFCSYRFRQAVVQNVVLPTRLLKRLVTIVLKQSGQEDLWMEEKQASNARVMEFLSNPAYQAVINKNPHLPQSCIDGSIVNTRWRLDLTDLCRALYLSSGSRSITEDPPAPADLETEFAALAPHMETLSRIFGPETEARKKILMLVDEEGGALFDLHVARLLLRMGHQVVLALKDGFMFYAPTMRDLEHDPLLKDAVREIAVLTDPVISKNALLRLLKENRFLIISDGTRETLNLYRTSVTFARAWKECDLVLAKGKSNYDVLLGTSHEFTRDILSYRREADGSFQLDFKARPADTYKFSEQDLIRFADSIIQVLREQKQAGKRIMFYSCIIGSIPGQTKTAIAIAGAFVGYLREKFENTYTINPAEHFVEGMDGDDLMFMWERVQRSGLLDVWRFQTVEDIEQSFALMDQKVPSAWMGKDSTFSTGCTKEMHIALDLQRSHRELQIIGPPAEQFFRRREYGVGKYFDVVMDG